MALDLSKVDVLDFLNELGMNNVREEGKDVWYSCFSDQHYRGDANPSASMEKGTTRFYCFSCGMHGNAVSFLSELENVSPIQSAIWIKERFIGSSVPDQASILDNVKEILTTKKATKTSDKLVPIDEKECTRRKIDWKSAIAWLEYSGQQRDKQDEPIDYMFGRGFTPEILDKFEIGYDKISERVVIPIRSVSGQLVGFKGRSLEENPRARYLVLGGPEYGFEPYQTRKVVFALDKAVGKELIVCEGELNAIAMHQHGYLNTVGISGKILSDEQVEMIKKHAERVILIFDEVEDAISNAKKLRSSIPTAIIPDHDKDPADMDATEIAWLLQSQRSSLLSLA